MGFTISVIGLGLMGASLARALKGFKGATITGFDINNGVKAQAKETATVDRVCNTISDAVQQADLVVFCVYARYVPALLEECIDVLKPGAVLTDICGVKTPLYQQILPLLPAGIEYVGVHPMAGRERDGIENADVALFQGSGFLVCPTDKSNPASIQLMEQMAKHIGAARIEVSPYQKHDEIIAYTSDLMHISAAALCINYHPDMTLTFAAGAFRDCTRIADINAAAWSELLLENRGNTLTCLGKYIQSLHDIQNALQAGDEAALYALLEQAGENKREMLQR